jgi:hypothetical protein
MLVSIKWHAVLYALSDATAARLMPRCRRRNTIRNSPLRLIMSFLPMEDEKIFAITLKVEKE